MTNDGNLGLAALLTGETNTASHAFREKLELSGETVVRPVFKAPCPGRRRSGGGRRRARGNTRRGADAHRYDQAENPVEKRLDETFFDPARARCGTRPWDTAVRDGSTLRFEDAIGCASRDGTPGSARTAKLRHEQGATLAHDSQLTAGPVRARLAAKQSRVRRSAVLSQGTNTSSGRQVTRAEARLLPCESRRLDSCRAHARSGRGSGVSARRAAHARFRQAKRQRGVLGTRRLDVVPSASDFDR
jgi:hypothetical protein